MLCAVPGVGLTPSGSEVCCAGERVPVLSKQREPSWLQVRRSPLMLVDVVCMVFTTLRVRQERCVVLQ